MFWSLGLRLKMRENFVLKVKIYPTRKGISNGGRREASGGEYANSLLEMSSCDASSPEDLYTSPKVSSSGALITQVYPHHKSTKSPQKLTSAHYNSSSQLLASSSQNSHKNKVKSSDSEQATVEVTRKNGAKSSRKLHTSDSEPKAEDSDNSKVNKANTKQKHVKPDDINIKSFIESS